MIIRKLVMHNFGIYAGTNEMIFTANKPVVLIGGMNGRGKTTFLEAVLLALYGSNSFAYSEDKKYSSYGQYLRAFINEIDGSLETYVELEFAMDKAGEEVYFVHRQWDGKVQRVREKLKVIKNGEDSDFLTENWAMFVENILPSALSNFFFFDGEKIAELAVEDTSEQMKESIKAMLGISTLDVLQTDLGRIISKITKKVGNVEDIKELETLRIAKEEAEQQLLNLDNHIVKLQEKKELLQEKREKKIYEYSVKGGDIADQREVLLKERSESQAKVLSIDEKLQEVAMGELPLAMVISLLKKIEKQSLKECENRRTQLAINKIESLYDDYSKAGSVTKEIREFIAYIKKNETASGTNIKYNLSDVDIEKLSELLNQGLRSTKNKVKSLRKERERSQRKINEIDNYLAVEIDDKSLNKIFKDLKNLEKDLINLDVEIEQKNKERSSLNGNHMVMEAQFSKMAESVLASLENKDSDEREIRYAKIADSIVVEYRKRLQKQKADMLAITMTKCYKQLANKKNHIQRIIIDSDTLDMHYMDENNVEIEKKGLSAGEKQLMVISLLWALAICSKKKLPVIIDTPLSRLDSAHRSALITRYFPNASDQTIILSTDSEIDERYYRMMKDSVGDTYTLMFNDNEKRTEIQTGYFGF